MISRNSQAVWKPKHRAFAQSRRDRRHQGDLDGFTPAVDSLVLSLAKRFVSIRLIIRDLERAPHGHRRPRHPKLGNPRQATACVPFAVKESCPPSK